MKQLIATFVLLAVVLHAQETMLFDFRNKQTCGWFGNHDIATVTPTDEGLHAVSSGREDPWIEGPVIPKLPEGDYEQLILEFRFKGTGDQPVPPEPPVFPEAAYQFPEVPEYDPGGESMHFVTGIPDEHQGSVLPMRF